MAKRQPADSKTKVDQAGRVLTRWIQEDEGEVAKAAEALEVVRSWRARHAEPLALVTPGVRNWVDQESNEVIVGQRLKRMPQIIIKLGRFPSMRLTQMEDIGGCRALLQDPGEVDAVARRIEAKWKVRDCNDYREHGKPRTGYRALHYVVIRRGLLIEVQLRTKMQHEWAEIVERTASRLAYDLKDGQGPGELIEYFRVASDIRWLTETGLTPDEGLIAELDELRSRVRKYFQ